MTIHEIESKLSAELCDLLYLESKELDHNKPFSELGLDSILGVELVKIINRNFCIELKASGLYDYPTIKSLSAYLFGALDKVALNEPLINEDVVVNVAAKGVFHAISITGDLSETGEVCFYYNIDVDNNACLRDHLIFKESVLPTDAYMELIYSTFKEHFGIDQLQLRNVKINRPFIGKAGISRLTKLAIKELSDGQLRFVISSGIKSENVEVIHIKGFIELENIVHTTPLLSIESGQEVEKNYNIEELKSSVYPIEVKGIYEGLLKSAAYSKNSAFGLIDLSGAVQQTYIAQLLDAGLFCSMSYGRYRLYQQDPDPYLPYEIEKITINNPSAAKHYRCVVTQSLISSEKIILGFEVMTEDGEVLFRIEGLQLRPVTEGQLLQSIAADQENMPVFSPVKASDVAVVGLSCRFPGAGNADQFWKNLSEGINSIEEIKKDHWGDDSWYNSDPHHEGTSYSKWAGFINDSDKFDPLFFGISPGEAVVMDPQQRLFLEESWKAIEDAGYSSEELARRKISVFVGAGSGDYFQLLKEGGKDGVGTAFTGSSQAILAARISYFMNFTGPALSIDTACSSSLVALDRACQSLLSGESEMALAGGISLLNTPLSHIWTSQVGMPSKVGNCKTFDDTADGIVSSEGVGVVVLKKLEDAKRDGDRIYAIIKGTGINQDGRTNGITAPSARSQCELQLSIYQNNQIDPSTISYVEAHGTGTRLGDPIEVDALTNAFSKYTAERQFCAIGSVKTNIGHTGYVAGIAGLIKTILMMKHRQIAPSLHYHKTNSEIDLENSPFYVNTELKEWKVASGSLRRAALSSFGFSGTNAHIVIEEYSPAKTSSYINAEPAVILLSARNKERLDDQVLNLKNYLASSPGINLHEIAYTLQLGRAPMEERLALVVANVEELLLQLEDYLEGKTADQFRGNIRKDKLDFLLEGESGRAYLQTAIKNKEGKSLAQLWVKGMSLDWRLFYPGNKPNKISLPTYPFARERYWISKSNTAVRATGSKLHPLLHSNSSNLKTQKYTSVYTGEESFFADHKLQEEKILPGVAYLELARAAGAQSMEAKITQLKEVTWLRPLRVNGTSEEVHISLHPSGDNVAYEVYSQNGGAEQVHSQGILSVKVQPAPANQDLALIQSRLKQTKEQAACYALFVEKELRLGTSFQGIERLYYSAEEALSRIRLPKQEGYVLTPGVLDSAIQTCIAWISFDLGTRNLEVPFNVREVSIYQELPESLWAYARKSNNNKATSKVTSYDIDLLNDAGEVLLSFKDFVTLPLEGISTGDAAVTEEEKIHLYDASWQESSVATVLSEADTVAPLVLLAGATTGLADQLKLALETEVIAIDSVSEEAYFSDVLEKVKEKLQEQGSSELIIVCQHAAYIDYGFVSGLLKTAHQENPKFNGKIISIESFAPQHTAELIRILEAEQGTGDSEVRYKSGKREVKKHQAVSRSSGLQGGTQVKEGGVYLITGGAGGLGLIFARHIGKTNNTKLILTGRGELNEGRRAALLELPNAAYHRCDVSNKEEVVALINTIKSTYGQLDGIIHSAGVIRDSFIAKKTKAELSEVLNAKILGAKNLDEATRNGALDFMVYFSSIAGVRGNIGQSDYAAANAYLDNYADYRNQEQGKGQRQGKTLSINWPLWKEGGMQVDQESIRHLEKQWGMLPLPTEDGCNAFDLLLSSNLSQGIVTFGKEAKIRIIEKQVIKPIVLQSNAPVSAEADVAGISEKATKKIVAIAARFLELDVHRIEIDERLGDYGFDSILLTRFANELNVVYDLDLMPTVFFNYPTVKSLVAFLIEDHLGNLVKQHGVIGQSTPPDQVAPVVTIEAKDQEINIQKSRFFATDNQQLVQPVTPDQRSAAVAIVGISGRFPGSPDLASFWENIKANKDLITEIPADRWDWKKYYGDPQKEKSKTKAKWGGFITDVDKFDPLFFNISPREAELMDPQQRITLQAVYQALEDAGISTDKIKGTNTGAFIAVASCDYSVLLNKQADLTSQAQFATGFAHSILVNRISYLLDIHGPSEPIDTACSSALIAIHKAVENIRNGHCDMAIAGGVNALLSPELTLSFSQAGMLSEEGKCRAFDQKANGYVRGEGVGVLILKSLTKAEQDGDHIYGLIRGTAENHGGKANTLTSPNPNAQKELLVKAYNAANIDPRDVSYIEAHGTGTPLGDPIEVEGLKSAFAALYKERNLGQPEAAYCGIGSVKANIGHLEAAAGMGGIMKVLLSLKHQTLPGNPQLETPNEYLKLEGSPFYLRQETTEWLTENNKPRIAGVSSFGFGGANAHIILEEYHPIPKEPYISTAAAIVVLSARNEERLQEQVTNLKTYLELNPAADLHDIAYTLQIGRTPMEERLAFVAADLKALLQQLEACLGGKTTGYFRGNTRKEKSDFSLKGGERYIDAIANKESSALAQLWVKGMNVDWNLLYPENKPNKISLPTYPFAQERYWIPEQTEQALFSDGRKLHPLLHNNCSNMKGQKYTSVYTGNEDFFTDHKVQSEEILPGVAYLELAREAGAQSMEATVTQLKEVTWLRPVRVKGASEEVHISLYPSGADVAYEIYSQQGGQEQVHSQGILSVKVQPAPANQDLSLIQSRLKYSKAGTDCYALFRAKGLDFGRSFQGIEQFYYSSEEALSRISLAKQESYVLTPGILDSAIQTCIGLSFDQEHTNLEVPFSVSEVTIYQELPENLWSYARKSSNKSTSKVTSYDIDLLNDAGEVLLSFKGLVTLPLEGISTGGAAATEEEKVHLYDASWQESSVATVLSEADTVAPLILLAGGTASLADQLKVALETEVIAITSINEEAYFSDVLEKVKEKLQEKGSSELVIVCQHAAYIDYGFVSGLLKTAHQENPKFNGKIIDIESFAPQHTAELIRILEAEQGTGDSEVRYKAGKRLVKKHQAVSGSSELQSGAQVKEGGIYLITGGAGGLGLIFARHISKTNNTKLILTGRGELNEERRTALLELPNAVYHRCDVSNKEEVVALINTIRSTYGQLDGIIHSAGVIRDSFIVKKTKAELSEVLSAKITGTKNLDEATRDEALDFMVYFSSIAGVRGNIGQSDYASANAYLDNYADYRNQEQAKGQRQGKTLSINWPLWKEGGMQIDQESSRYLEQQWGMLLLPTAAGCHAFDTLLNSNLSQGIVAFGKERRIADVLTKSDVKKIKSLDAFLPEGEALSELKTASVSYIRTLLCKELRLPEEKLELDAPFERYGIDSILINRLTNRLEEVIGNIPKTLFFEYQTLGELVDYFIEEHTTKLQELTAVTSKEPVYINGITNHHQRAAAGRQKKPFEAIPTRTEDIAIIGLSGRYPGAKNINEFWENLKQGTDSITEIPKDRWNIDDFYDQEKGKVGKTYSKWGGFIADVDKFDPLFFNISPREAELMSPQERLFLQAVWETVEDAGYTRLQLQDDFKTSDKSESGGKVGVFVGVMSEEYQLFGMEEMHKGNFITPGGSPASIANRISYFFNFHGPNMVIDTMCSSSLTAIHLACESIQNGNCELAIAGGVNVSTHPYKYLMLSNGRFVSGKGKCESFGEGGEGYVPSEGVGAVLLKPLSQAEADGDRIYGVIKGTAINHGGKTNGYTVPNPHAQSAVIKQALKKAGVKAEDFSYIEAHGTGTSLGDPIEIAGLSKVFKSSKNQYCSIGSVKSNIGHCESAAGMSGLTKLLLQLKHKQLVPSLHSSILNPNINFENSPFKVQQKLEIWASEADQLRLAGINSFGAGGSNAHIVIEEYRSAMTDPYFSTAPAVILLSAKNKNRLDEQVLNLKKHLTSDLSLNLHEIAYTLQVGREEMEERLALVVNDVEELLQQLGNYLEGKTADQFRGNVKKDEPDFLLEGEAGRAYLEIAVKNKDSKSLAQLWVKGLSLDWSLCYPDKKPNKISLPTYPFQLKRYWIQTLPSPSVPLIPKYQDEKRDVKKEFRPKPVSKTASLQTALTKEQIASRLSTALSGLLYLEQEELDRNKVFNELGLDSILGVELIKIINKGFNIDLKASKLYDYPSINRLSAYLHQSFSDVPEPDLPIERSNVQQLKTVNPVQAIPDKLSLVSLEDYEPASKAAEHSIQLIDLLKIEDVIETSSVSQVKKPGTGSGFLLMEHLQKRKQINNTVLN